ncbi:MAG: acetyl-CoA hydrolase, partial [Pseudomonadales bacterium]|nr:acetyl-CoA hydrolase [Pseudomonadales bacterium]
MPRENRTGPAHFQDSKSCAHAIVESLEGDVRLGLPLGLGKPPGLVNALYAIACEDRSVRLHIYTALTLEIPAPAPGLESRFLAPIISRLYRDVVPVDFVTDLRAGRLPANVRVTEFFLRPGAWLGHAAVQRAYISTNYTTAARDLLDNGVNVLTNMVACEHNAEGKTPDYSLGCNPDVTLDMIDLAMQRGAPVPLIVGETNPALPFMEGDARVGESFFDMIVTSPEETVLFPVPNRPLSITDHAIAVRAATLVKDGGTLQIGIGSLGDGIAAALAKRQQDNAAFRRIVQALGHDEAGQLSTFETGLYGASEMLVEGFLHLRQHGVLKRTVQDGVFLHAGFFLGSAHFYRLLASLGKDSQGIRMSRISFTNSLTGDEASKRSDRVAARFMNEAMKVTLSGAVVSDALENGQVVSGVGGQYNFVAMAHELPDARSIIMLPATRTDSEGRLESNIVWHYAHTTVPRHLRDIVITEYGIADLRGQSDEEIIRRLLAITDSRFQQALASRAIAAGKLDPDYRVPKNQCSNLPEHIEAALAGAGVLHELPCFPLGTDFTETEAVLAVALQVLKEHRGHRKRQLRWLIRGITRRKHDVVRECLVRMQLDRPKNLRSFAYA